MPKVEIRRIQDGDRPAIIALSREIWGDDTARRLDQHWEWKFETNPANMDDEPVVWVAEDEGRIVATVAGMWTRFKIGSEVTRQVWTTDFMVDPAHRGRLGLQIGKHSIFWGPHITMGYPVDERVYALWMRLHGSDTAPMVVHSYIIKPGYRLRRRGAPLPIVRLANLAWRTAMAVRSAFVKGAAPGVNIEEITSFSPAYDELWDRVSDGYTISVVRDQAFLRWRFLHCPSRRYRILQATRQGALTGYLVFRIADDEHHRVGYIVDVLAARRDGETIRSLFLHAVRVIRDANTDTLQFYTTDRDPALLRDLRRIGFLASRISNKGCYYDHRDEKSGADITDPANWHATHADSDLDLY
ncbi:MAG: GNAT family N-acetyltransferase [Gemmatimonadetes bacterium]|nr:GNAT family N-acetyltransferase [Gemmatimonadota bacterium]